MNLRSKLPRLYRPIRRMLIIFELTLATLWLLTGFWFFEPITLLVSILGILLLEIIDGRTV